MRLHWMWWDKRDHPLFEKCTNKLFVRRGKQKLKVSKVK